MLGICQGCKKNTANVELNLGFNDEVKKVNLCEKCYEAFSKHMQLNNSNQGGSSSMLDDLINGIMNGQVTDKQKNENSIIESFGENLNNKVQEGKVDPVIGRQKEIKQIIKTLNRRRKNNPVLIGEPGVGKTAIAEGLAMKIVEGDVPAKLLDKKIVVLDVASMVAGTGIRGQLEQKVKDIVEEAKKRKDLILFIDEIHQLVGAGGSGENSLDIGNIIKPALARGDIQLIGATTLKEYRKIEKDAALERRFEPIKVKEPTVEEAIEILKGIKFYYETFHDVTYSDEVIEACVKLSSRYIQERFLPDKAIDLIDRAGAELNLMFGDDQIKVDKALVKVKKEKEYAIMDEDYEKAEDLRKEELRLKRQISQYSKKTKKVKSEVTLPMILNIIEEQTGIPVNKLQTDDKKKIKNLDKALKANVIGQDEAVDKVVGAIKRSRVGLKPKNRPIGSFLFIGPTGVGKTELAKALANEMFGSEHAMIRFDMSEFMEKHTVSKLIGAPPGYIGHDQAGQLTEKVRRNPYSIILLDEIEKAHPDVQNIFLQIMEDGRLTDSHGKVVNFENSVIIMTSNAGVAIEKSPMGFGGQTITKSKPTDKLKSFFRPEMLNRFDTIVNFNHLTKNDLIKIVDLMIEEVQVKLAENNYKMNVTTKAKEKLAELGYDVEFGARPLRRVIQEHIEDKIAELLIDDEIENIKVRIKEGELYVTNE